MGKEIYLNFAGKFKQNGLEVGDAEILFWSLIYVNHNPVFKLWKVIVWPLKCILEFYAIFLWGKWWWIPVW
jgi:hypothetical protein